MPWRYGIIKFRSEKDPNFRFYGVGELFYNDDPLVPYACSQAPDTPYSDEDSDDEIKKSILWALEAMTKDCQKYPIFDVDGPFSKAPWDGKNDLNSITQDQIDSMTNEELEVWLESDKS
jgi:hypothetical protein